MLPLTSQHHRPRRARPGHHDRRPHRRQAAVSSRTHQVLGASPGSRKKFALVPLLFPLFTSSEISAAEAHSSFSTSEKHTNKASTELHNQHQQQSKSSSHRYRLIFSLAAGIETIGLFLPRWWIDIAASTLEQSDRDRESVGFDSDPRCRSEGNAGILSIKDFRLQHCWL